MPLPPTPPAPSPTLSPPQKMGPKVNYIQEGLTPSIKIEPSRSTRLLPAKLNKLNSTKLQNKVVVKPPQSDWIISPGVIRKVSMSKYSPSVLVTFSGLAFFSQWYTAQPTCESQLKCARDSTISNWRPLLEVLFSYFLLEKKNLHPFIATKCIFTL